MVGCTKAPFTKTVIPTPAVSKQISYSGNTQNAGVIDFYKFGVKVDKTIVDRYNNLIKIYGTKFQVPLKENDGITEMTGTNFYIMDYEHYSKFLDMNRWFKSTIKPGQEIK